MLRILSEGGASTASELIDRTGLTRTTVLAVCDDLIEAGWVNDTHATAAGRAGRPARRMELVWDAAYVIGIDVGIFHSTVLLTDLAGTTLARSRADFAAHQYQPDLTSPAERLAGVEQAVDAVIRDAGIPRARVRAVGVGLAAPVSRSGRVPEENEFWASLAILGVDGLPSLPGVPVLVDNDANLAARAERWRGHLTDVDNAVVILAGRRLGSGVIEHGRVLHGHRGGIGELGFLREVKGVGDSHGMAYVAEVWGREALAAGATTMLADLCGGDPEQLTAEHVFDAAAAGDATAKRILRRLADRAARVVGVLATITAPEVVVLAGGIASAGSALLPAIRTGLPKYVDLVPRVEISGLGDDVVALGAVWIALDHVIEHAIDMTLE